jgi:tRNA 5-methylaminomethyl-2-thiouridine biosynthesis bifunctional protein
VIRAADLSWLDEQPYSNDFNDIYFDKKDGLGESCYVFLAQNNLPQAWLKKKQFTIAELGFGSGLNFLVTIKRWLETAPAYSTLHYLSIEKFPFTAVDVQRALSCFAELNDYLDDLVTQLPAIDEGQHELILFDGRVQLTLVYGDVVDVLPNLAVKADVWYLDGFAPQKNSKMWDSNLFQWIARKTQYGGSFATFTASGVVRRALSHAGFNVEKVKGFAGKREMLCGKLRLQPWFFPSINNLKERSVSVIGAGIAGCSVAFHLAELGWQVTLIDQFSKPALQASGNLTGIVMPNPSSDYYCQAFSYTVDWLNKLKKNNPELPWFSSGVAHLMSAQELAKLSDSVLYKKMSVSQMNKKTNKILSRIGIYYSQGGFVNPAGICEALLADQSENIHCFWQQKVKKIQRNERGWEIFNEANQNVAKSQCIVLANGEQYDAISPFDLPLTLLQGQVDYVQTNDILSSFKSVIVYENGYLIPEFQQKHCLGATFDLTATDSTLSRSGSLENRKNLYQGTKIDLKTGVLDGKVGFRTTTPDHLPVVGGIPDFLFYKTAYSDLCHGKPLNSYPLAQNIEGLYVSVAHGSRGLVSAPYGALLLANLMEDRFQYSQTAVHPARFLIRQLKKGSLS